MYHNHFTEPNWFIIVENNHAGFIPNGNISSPHIPELFDNEDAWKARCQELNIELPDDNPH